MNKRPEDMLIVPLDVPNLKKARVIVEELEDEILFYKVGLQLFTGSGPSIIDYLKSNGKKVFLDLKLHDIPNTISGALGAAVDLNVDLLTIHTMGGFEMMEAAQKMVWKRGKKKPVILGVTVLTSLDEAFLHDIIGISKPLKELTIDLSKIAQSAGLGGVVASPLEVSRIKKKCGKDFLVVTPGIRPEGSAKDDQKRYATPEQAIINGSDFLVCGRPITKSKDPKESALKIKKEISSGLQKTS